MEVKILNSQAQEKGKVKLPNQFNEEVRKDLVQRAVQAIQQNTRQAYGADPEAGKKSSSYISKRRRKYRGTYGIGQSRSPRKVMSRSGTRFNMEGAFAPNTRGGRRAHPPKADKIWALKINKNENRKAIRSALSSTMQKELVAERGHKVPDAYPFVISDDFTKISKTTELMKSLVALGFQDEIKRVSEKKIRAGKGKARGRRYKTKTGILFVVAEPCELVQAITNIPGTDVELVTDLNCELLAPGAQLGRLTLYTESAIKKISEQKLFMQKKNMPKTQTGDKQ